MGSVSSKAARLARIANIPVVPYGQIASMGYILDPILCLGTLDSSHLTVDLAAGEVVGPTSTSGILKSHSSNAPYVGWITGVTVSPDAEVQPLALQEHLKKVFLVITAGGQTRSIPLAECVRIQPYVSAVMPTTVGLTAAYTPMATCGPPGKPAYKLTEPVAWDGLPVDSLALMSNGAALTGSIAYSVRFFGGFMIGSADDVGAICDKVTGNIAAQLNPAFLNRDAALMRRAMSDK